MRCAHESLKAERCDLVGHEESYLERGWVYPHPACGAIRLIWLAKNIQKIPTHLLVLSIHKVITMASQNGIRVGLGAPEVESIMGVEKGSLGPIGWLVIQEESHGLKRGDLATALNVDVADIEAMIHTICGGETQAESEIVWNQGIIALKTAAMLTQTMLRQGWDTVEAMALQKLSASISEMRGNGDAEQMMRIAATANKALRRGQGEGNQGRNPIGAGAQVDIGVTLASGNLGKIQLRLSENIQRQMSSPGRVIDATPRVSDPNRNSMLGLNETRQLLEGVEVDSNQESKLPEAKGAFHFDLSNGPDVEFGKLIQGENKDDD